MISQLPILQVARDAARLTHAHTSGVHGGVLQSMAIKLALQQPTGTLKPVEFVDCLMEKIGAFEELTEEPSPSDQQSQLDKT